MSDEESYNEELLTYLLWLVRRHERARFPGQPQRRLFEDPLMAVAWARDPMFQSFKDIIGPFHQTPEEIFREAFPHRVGKAELFVVCYALPIDGATRAANRRKHRYPHRDWMLTKIHGERFNEWLRGEMARWITQKGYSAVAPVLQTTFLQFPLLDGDITSNWSERHACYVAGLGTFGLSRGLITRAGVAVRLGTVVTDLPLRPTPRDYGSVHSYCLFLTRGQCGVCIHRCPAGAITPTGMDKMKCQAHQLDALRRRGPALGLGLQVTGHHLSCGLCQTGVPCEARNPGK
ncbi:MAG: epoxyqueuosine reductase [Thermodesulfobacteriota bacterium]